MGDTPTPERFYVHDDLTDDVRERYGAGSPALALVEQLVRVCEIDPHHVRHERLLSTWISTDAPAFIIAATANCSR